VMKTRVAIVTGASQGIGRATAIRLARDFEAVALTARQENELKKTAAAVESAGAEPLTYPLDLREPRSAESQHSFRAPTTVLLLRQCLR
jgi:3-oxoacyl-[acyl-carrier protein] reductase